MKHRFLSMLSLAVVFLVCALPAPAQQFEGVPAKTGHVSFKFGSQALSYSYVEGGFQAAQGFTVATLVFKTQAKPKDHSHLNLTLMYKAPGKLDLDGPFSIGGLGMFSNGDVSGFTKGKSKCTIILTKATPTEVEGTADCPLLHNIEGEVGTPVTGVKFYATTK